MQHCRVQYNTAECSATTLDAARVGARRSPAYSSVDTYTPFLQNMAPGASAWHTISGMILLLAQQAKLTSAWINDVSISSGSGTYLVGDSVTVYWESTYVDYVWVYFCSSDSNDDNT